MTYTCIRMTLRDLDILSSALGLPLVIKTPEGYSVTRREGFAILLHRLAWPHRLFDLSCIYGRSSASVSCIYLCMLTLVHDSHKQLLELDVIRLIPQLPVFAKAIVDAGGILGGCWGFIDGTARRICRPIHGQRLFYSGHKRMHCLKFQGVTTPDGIIAHLYGPVAGRHHDIFVLNDSGLRERVRNTPAFANYILYGDPGYSSDDVICAPFKHNITEEEEAFNTSMSSVRVSVEWSFGYLTNLFGSLDFKRVQRIWLSPVSKMYLVATILANCITCMRGHNEVSLKFGLDPPTLEQYLGRGE
jgi:hypothetical protein